MKIAKFLLVGGLILSSHLHAAEIQSHKIFDSLSQSNQSQHEIIKSETQSLYNTMFKKLKDQGITTLNQEDVPMSVEVKDSMGKLSHLKFSAVADNDDTKQGIRVTYNTNGKIAPPVIAETANFAKQNQGTLHDGNFLEFTILHELGHLQHDKIGYMNERSLKEMSKDELLFIQKEKNKEYNKSIDGRHQEQIADMFAAVWLIKINNFSEESIQTVKSFKQDREQDLNSIQKKYGKDIISYDTASGLNFVLEHLDEIKNLDNSQILEYISYNSTKLTKQYAQNILQEQEKVTTTQIDPKVKYAFNLSNVEKIRQVSLSNNSESKLKI